MSEKEKDILKKISEAVPKLDKEKQNYILGVAEGMAMVRQSGEKENAVKEVSS